MFGRNSGKTGDQSGSSSTGATAAPRPADAIERSGPGPKGRPTPTRREAEAARRQPLVPTDRKAAARASKQKERAERVKQREAMMAGQQWAMLPRDRGPEKAFIRDVIDARWNVGEFVLPIMLIGLPLTMIRNATTATVGILLVYGAMLATVVDTAIANWQLKRRYQAKFGVNPPRGTAWLVTSRVLQMRRTRVPRPRVVRGGHPH